MPQQHPGPSFEGWPGLPNQFKTAPTLEGANYFFLGCCVDFRQLTYVAWRKAREFCTTKVPAKERGRMWKWIAKQSAEEWAERFKTFPLHSTKVRHNKLRDIANKIETDFDGDPRNIWAKHPEKLLATLEDDFKLGPAVSRMIVGALRDHGLVNLKSADLKPDTHVCRLMKATGLSRSDHPGEVLAASRTLFHDPWVADSCFYNLGASYDVKTKADFFKAY